MSGDPAGLSAPALSTLVRQLIAEVLAVPVERILPETRLSAELGAESIDYVDLIFRLEESLDLSVTAAGWAAFLRERLPEGNYGERITTDIVQEFVERVVREGRTA